MILIFFLLMSMLDLMNVVCESFDVMYILTLVVLTCHEYLLQLIRKSFEKIRYEFIFIVILPSREWLLKTVFTKTSFYVSKIYALYVLSFFASTFIISSFFLKLRNIKGNKIMHLLSESSF